MFKKILPLLRYFVLYYLLRGSLHLEATLGPIELLRVAWVGRADVFGLDFQLKGFGAALAFHFTKAAGTPKLFLVLAGLGTHSVSIASQGMREMEAQEAEARSVEAEITAAYEAMQEEPNPVMEQGVPPGLEYEEEG